MAWLIENQLFVNAVRVLSETLNLKFCTFLATGIRAKIYWAGSPNLSNFFSQFHTFAHRWYTFFWYSKKTTICILKA